MIKKDFFYHLLLEPCHYFTQIDNDFIVFANFKKYEFDLVVVAMFFRNTGCDYPLFYHQHIQRDNSTRFIDKRLFNALISQGVLRLNWRNSILKANKELKQQIPKKESSLTSCY